MDMELLEDDLVEQVSEEFTGVSYSAIDGAEVTIENIEKAIAVRKLEVERAEFIENMIKDGTFHKFFSLGSRQHLISLATSHMVDPLSKNKMQDELLFHAMLEPQLLSMVNMKNFRLAEIDAMEQTIKEMM